MSLALRLKGALLPFLIYSNGLAAQGNPLPRREQSILFLGDSITAGYGISPEEAFPALLQDLWKKEGLPFKVRNAGVSGITSAGTLENLDWVLTDGVIVVFLELGANDGLRGLSLDQTEKNLEKIVLKIQRHGALVVLAGMKLPPNFGKDYTHRFESMYGRLAKKFKLKKLPFLLEGVAGRPEFNIPDGIHPNVAGHRIIAERIHQYFKKENILP